MRLRSVVPRIFNGVNSVGTFLDASNGTPGDVKCCGVK